MAFITCSVLLLKIFPHPPHHWVSFTFHFLSTHFGRLLCIRLHSSKRIRDHSCEFRFQLFRVLFSCTFSFLARETHCLNQMMKMKGTIISVNVSFTWALWIPSNVGVLAPCNPAFIAFEHPLPTHPLLPDIPVEYQRVEIDPLITNGSNLPEYQVQQVTDQYPAMKKKDYFKSALDQWKGIQCFENDLRSFLLSSNIFICTLCVCWFIYKYKLNLFGCFLSWYIYLYVIYLYVMNVHLEPSGECRVWSVESRVWSVECRVWSVECRVWGLECGVWRVKCWVWSVECKV